MKGWVRAARLARRELRGGLKGFRIFLACLVLGVGAIAAVQSLAAGILDGLRENGREILGGDVAYRRAASIIPIVALGYTLQALYFVTVAPVFFAKKTKLLPPLTIAAAVLNVGLNLLLIPVLGIAGAAWATLASFGLLAAGAVAIARSRALKRVRLITVSRSTELRRHPPDADRVSWPGS